MKGNKKRVIILLIIVSMITIFFAFKTFINKKELPEVKLQEKDKPNKALAIMISEDGEKYKEYEGEEWPKGYIYKRSECVDNNGNEVEEIVTYEEETNKITLKSKKTVYCTIYFDYKGTGEKDLPYRIKYIEDLVKLSEDVNNGEAYEGKYFELGRDLDFNKESDYINYQSKDYGDINGSGTDEELKTELTSGSGFKPIGVNSQVTFNGNFDGKEYEIKNLYIRNNKTAGMSIGLFGSVKEGEIKNLRVDGDIKSDLYSNSGIVIGRAEVETIDNCISKGKIISIAGDWSTGGIVGAVYGEVNIKNSHNEATVTGGAWIGGLVGGFGSGTLTIEDSDNIGTISKVDDVSIQGIGGLVGAAVAANDTYNITIKNSENKGEVKDRPVGARETYVGGLIGRTYVNTTIEGSNNQGTVSAEGVNATISYVGGIIGLDNNANQTITITSSHNTGTISSNVTQNIYVGGLMGASFGKLNIDKSYNEGTVVNNRVDYSQSLDLCLGGIVAYTSSRGVLKTITNTYNNGPVLHSNRAGGMVGYSVGGSIVIMDNCYNGLKGEITTDRKPGGNAVNAGGFIGYSFATAYILNSYNLGNVTSTYGYANGFIGNIRGNGNIINSYNLGNINSPAVPGGIGTDDAASTQFYVNNVYNLGNITSDGDKYGIGYFVNMTPTIINAYFKNDTIKTGSNITSSGLIGKLEKDIKTQTFADILNNNIKNVNLESIDAMLKNYTLKRWEIGESGYPILVDSKIEDLSGNGHDAINYGIRKDDTGITTSINSTLGYINTQVKNHIFTNGLTFITRVKINNFASGMAIMGNWEGQTGGGLYYRNYSNKEFCFDMYELNPTSLCSTDAYNENTWYTLVGTYNNGVLKLYIINNGKITKYSLETTGTFTINNNAPITIGVDPDMNGNFVGGHNYGMLTVSDALIFDRALSEEEIEENYSNDLNPKNKDKLLLWYKF